MNRHQQIPRKARPIGWVPTLVMAATLVSCGAPEPAMRESATTSASVAIDDSVRGLIAYTSVQTPGYVLYAPLLSDTTYLIDNEGRTVHTWKSQYAPSGAVYLKENGHLLRGAREPEVEVFSGGGQGGRFQEFDWDGELIWDYLYASDEHLSHHDIEPLPNGHILAISWERKTAEEALGAGRRPDLIPEAGLWPDQIVELEPLPPSGARIVWEWHSWDHLIQDQNASLANYGDPAAHPERIDINGNGGGVEVSDDELEELKALGYVSEETEKEDLESDLFHTNAVAYNAELDQIALSTPEYGEIWIIDHSTTTAEAAGSSGGRWGRGGDLLYRWGNPQSYGSGDESDRTLGYQHDVRWIPRGLPGEGHLLIFNNRAGDEENEHSSVVEIAPPQTEPGRYIQPASGAFGPDQPVWAYSAPDPSSFNAPFISGSQRLANGHTLINSGPQGRFFEVTPAGEIVWEYRDPYSGDVRMPDGSMPHPVDEFTHAVFRATRIAPDHGAIAERSLTPLNPQPSLPSATLTAASP